MCIQATQTPRPQKHHDGNLDHCPVFFQKLDPSFPLNDRRECSVSIINCKSYLSAWSPPAEVEHSRILKFRLNRYCFTFYHMFACINLHGRGCGYLAD